MIRVVPPGPGSLIRSLTFYPSRIQDPGSRSQKGTGYWIRDLDPQHSLVWFYFLCRSQYSIEELYFNKCHTVLQSKHTFMQGGGFWKQSRNYGTSTYQQCLRSSYCIWIRILAFSVIENIFLKDTLEYGSGSDPGLLNKNQCGSGMHTQAFKDKYLKIFRVGQIFWYPSLTLKKSTGLRNRFQPSRGLFKYIKIVIFHYFGGLHGSGSDLTQLNPSPFRIL